MTECLHSIFQVLEKKSYGLNCVVWVRQGGLQSDIQKILRHARKLPDKTQSFYKVSNWNILSFLMNVCLFNKKKKI